MPEELYSLISFGIISLLAFLSIILTGGNVSEAPFVKDTEINLNSLNRV
jgi:hypothetical protein